MRETTRHALDRFGGTMMVAAMLAAIPWEFQAISAFGAASAAATILAMIAFAPSVHGSRRVFLAIGLALIAAAILVLPDWPAAIGRALIQASFIAAFFTALIAIRAAAIDAPSILECGRFLAGQPPGRRYLALTLGGQLFGVILLYGSISLLGGLATSSAGEEGDEEIRRHRLRRMLVAIQRGFVSTLTWSPLAFATAITISIVPGARWIDILPICIVSAILLTGIGWALDTIFKPRLSHPPPLRSPAESGWLRHLAPLLALLAVIVLAVAAAHALTGVRVVGAVMAVVPLIALLWEIALSAGNLRARIATAGRKARKFATVDIPALHGELVLLVMAGFIGTLGAALALGPMAASGIELSAIPTPVFLVMLFWIVPITGQIGMNPILAVSLIAPLIPSPEDLGVAPGIVVAAITGGWALSGATSPFTASVLLIAQYGEVSPSHVGLRWNGVYALVSGIALSSWVIALSYLL